MWDDIAERFAGGETFTLTIKLINGETLSRVALVGMYAEGFKIDRDLPPETAGSTLSGTEWVWLPMASVLYVTLEDL